VERAAKAQTFLISASKTNFQLRKKDCYRRFKSVSCKHMSTWGCQVNRIRGGFLEERACRANLAFLASDVLLHNSCTCF
jgi:hypothetical protein